MQFGKQFWKTNTLILVSPCLLCNYSILLSCSNVSMITSSLLSHHFALLIEKDDGMWSHSLTNLCLALILALTPYSSSCQAMHPQLFTFTVLFTRPETSPMSSTLLFSPLNPMVGYTILNYLSIPSSTICPFFLFVW